MSSTEFTVGINGTRVSSKVLRPPGGGSSDIFGMGSRGQSHEAAGKPSVGKEEDTDTQNRLFGIQSNVYNTPVKPTKKAIVCRNPITGEEIDYACNDEIEKTEQVEKIPVPETQVPETRVPELPVPETQVPETRVPELPVPETQVPELPVPELSVRPIQTSIRVRNPPGGKSSGIF